MAEPAVRVYVIAITDTEADFEMMGRVAVEWSEVTHDAVSYEKGIEMVNTLAENADDFANENP